MNMDDFLNDPIEYNKEIRNRIRLSVAAYAYEMRNESIMDDAEYDRISKEIDVSETTGNKKMDNFFKKSFDADTGQWIHKHPELRKVAFLYDTSYCFARETK